MTYGARVLAALFALLLLALPVAAQDRAHVLLLFPYDNSQPNLNIISEAARARLTERAGSSVIIHSAFLDLINFPSEADKARTTRQIKETYATTRLSAILALGTDSLKFVIEHRDAFAPGVPVVFCCAEQSAVARLGDLPQGVTGVASVTDVGKAAELATILQPDLERFVVINGASPTDEDWIARFKSQLEPIAAKFEVTYLDHMTLADIQDQVSHLPKDTAILFGLFFEDATGQHFATAEALGQVIKAASVPVYVHTETLIGTGAVGGYMATYRGVAGEAADIVYEILQGASPDNFPTHTTTDLAYRVDARALQRWGLEENALPPGSVVMNREQTLWQLYRDQVIAAFAVIILQSFLLAALLLQFSRRKRAEQAMQAAQAGLARVTRMTTMGEMAASIAHEVNQPLAAIVANGNAALRWLGRTTPDIGEARLALQRITDDGMRAAEVIASVRGMFGDKGARARVDLAEVVRGVLVLTRGEIDAGGVTLKSQIADLPPVMADRVQLQQVVLNLVINAVEAMQSVSANARTLTVNLAAAATGVELRVTDSGLGIDAADRERIFEAFFTTKPKGMGMGLSICRSIVEAHGGKLTVAATDERGTTFSVWLPASE